MQCLLAATMCGFPILCKGKKILLNTKNASKYKLLSCKMNESEIYIKYENKISLNVFQTSQVRSKPSYDLVNLSSLENLQTIKIFEG